AGPSRERAARCGCVGLKPTYGRVPSRGVIPLSLSLDHVGPLTATVADAAVVLQAIAGYDAADITTANVPVADYVAAPRESSKSLRVGVPRAYFYEGLDAEVAAAMGHALAGIRTLVAEVKEVTLNVPTDRSLQSAESYAYHAAEVAKSPEMYQEETLRRIRSGANISAADYIQRRREMDEARLSIRDAFTDVDVLVTPTMLMPAPRIDALMQNPDALRHA